MLLLTLFSTNLLHAQLPTELPVTPGALELANLEIAEFFAPTIKHMAEREISNSAHGRADLITSVFYDGNYNTGDNWDNLDNYLHEDLIHTHQLDPYVYYSVVWLENHWVVTYAFYHPRDYAEQYTICCPDNHENDLEGAIFVVDRATNTVTNGGTISHSNILLFEADGIPEIFIDNGGHAVKANIGTGSIGITPLYECDNLLPFSLPHIEYTYDNTQEPFVDANEVTVDGKDLLEGEGNYVLEDIFGLHVNSLINHRSNPNVFTGPNENEFYNHTPSSNHDCQGESNASAPWGWSQFNYSALHLAALIEGGNDPEDTHVVLFNPYGTSYTSLCNNPTEEVITESQTRTTPFNSILNKLVVKTGATFTIKNTTLELASGGSIFLETGSKLIIDNTKVTTCDDQWDRLYMDGGNEPADPFGQLAPDEAPVVIIKNGSIIEKSGHGITNQTDAFNDWSCQTQPCTWARGMVIALNSTFRHNYKAVGIMGAHANRSRIKWCTFEDNYQGIRVYNTQNVKVENCTFSNHEADGIFAVDAYINIKGGNKFLDNSTAINIKGTYPGVTGVNIGDPDGNYNQILHNKWGITLNGATHPAAALIYNNKIEEHFGELNGGLIYPGYNIAPLGDVFYRVENNTFNRSPFSVFPIAAGDELNRTNCNDFRDIVHHGIYYYGNNAQSQFLQNDFLEYIAHTAPRVVLHDGVLPDQGITSATSNCFAQENPNFSDIEINNSSSFEYSHLEVPCEIPDDPNGYNLLRTDVEIDRCDDQIGIFGFLQDEDPDIFTLSDFDADNPNQFDVSNICKSCIEQNIANYESLLGSGTQIENYENQQSFENWLLYGLFVSQMTYDYDFGISLLAGRSEWKYQKRLFGLYLMKRDYASGMQFLNTLNPLTDDQVAFKDVQIINLDRLTNIGQEYSLAESDRTFLIDIAHANIPSSGYARSLLALLTGEELPIVIPEIDRSENRSAQTISKSITLSPNPTKESISLNYTNLNELVNVIIRDLNGHVLMNKKILIEESTNFDVSFLKAGIYTLELNLKSETIFIDKFVKI